MTLLEQKLEAQFAAQREEIRRLKREHGGHVISDVTVSQLYGGARGVTAVVCDTSEVDPYRGLIIRGRPAGELQGIVAEELLWLLLTGELPAQQEADSVYRELERRRSDLVDELQGLAESQRFNMHPVVGMCVALQWLQRHSRFAREYYKTSRSELWRLALDDAFDILATLPEVILALKGGSLADGDFATRLGHAITAGGGMLRPYAATATLAEATPDPRPQTPDPRPQIPVPASISELMRLYVLVHCDHEGSNACALACRTAASAHADPYLALTAGWRALAGPIHGLASQVCIEFIDELRGKLGDAPSDEQLTAEVQARIAGGRVIPGFGHAVLRAMDPRYELLHAFAMRHFPDNPAVRIADGLLRVVPPLLQATGKVANPWPNVDGISGAVMQHYGLTDYRWLTVLFAACMSLGLLAQLVISRGLGEPILHPKGITPQLLRQRLSG